MVTFGQTLHNIINFLHSYMPIIQRKLQIYCFRYLTKYIISILYSIFGSAKYLFKLLQYIMFTIILYKNYFSLSVHYVMHQLYMKCAIINEWTWVPKYIINHLYNANLMYIQYNVNDAITQQWILQYKYLCFIV